MVAFYTITQNDRIIPGKIFTKGGFFEYIQELLSVEWPGLTSIETQNKKINNRNYHLNVCDNDEHITIKFSRTDENCMYLNGYVWEAFQYVKN